MRSELAKSWTWREARWRRATWRSSDVSDERTKTNGTEVDRATSFVRCRTVFKRAPRPVESSERVLKNTIFNFLTKKTCNFANISVVRSRTLLMKRKSCSQIDYWERKLSFWNYHDTDKWQLNKLLHRVEIWYLKAHTFVIFKIIFLQHDIFSLNIWWK